MAGWVRVPAVWRPTSLWIDDAKAVAVRQLSAPGLADGWDHPAQYQNAADSLVLGSLLDDD